MRTDSRGHGRPTILTIAGLDPSGRAGIAADLRAIEACGGHGAAIVSLLTIQDQHGVQRVDLSDPELVAGQLASVLDAEDVRAIKTGALGHVRIAEVIAEGLRDRAIALVVDPVLKATSGGTLVGSYGGSCGGSALWTRATLVTPNIPEAEAMLGRTISDVEDMAGAALALAERGPAVLLKGGHLEAGELVDMLAIGPEIRRFSHRRLAFADSDIQATRGTGCRLASAIATYLGRGDPIDEAVDAGRRWLQADLQTRADSR